MNDERVWGRVHQTVVGRTLVNANTHFADSISALAACGYPLLMVDVSTTREAALGAWQALPPR